MEYLREHNLVIAPAKALAVDNTHLQKKLAAQKMATYKQIADSGIWGDITKERVVQLALQHCRANEIVKIGYGKGEITKVTKGAIARIARLRGFNTIAL